MVPTITNIESSQVSDEEDIQEHALSKASLELKTCSIQVQQFCEM
jgi:hypothetical protein